MDSAGLPLMIFLDFANGIRYLEKVFHQLSKCCVSTSTDLYLSVLMRLEPHEFYQYYNSLSPKLNVCLGGGERSFDWRRGPLSQNF